MPPAEPAAPLPLPGDAPAGQASAASFAYPTIGALVAGRFEVLEQIGKEAGGLVFRVRDRQEDRIVALWMIPPAACAEVDFALLEQEAGLSRRLQSKNLVSLFGLARHQGGLICWMEFVAGQRLRDLMAKKRNVSASPGFSLKGAFNLVANLLQALAGAHPSLPHGALSPSAVLVDGRGRVRLLGLGLTRHLPPSAGSQLYRAPERQLLPASDVYSVALMFTELVTGEASVAAVANLPAALRPTLEAALRLDPAQRTADLETFRGQLQRSLQQLKTEEEAARSLTEPVAAEDLCATDPGPAANAAPAPASPRPAPPPAVAPAPPAPRRMKTPPPGYDDSPKRSHSSILLRKALEKFKPPGKHEAIWLAHKDGLDYGPFTIDELTDRVRREEFDQTTLVQDLVSGQRKPLLEFQEFAAPLARLLREREAKRREAEAVRSGQIRAAKKMGKGMIFLIILGGSTFAGVTSWLFLRSPEPRELLYAETMGHLGRPFSLPALEPAEAIASRIKAEEEQKALRRARALAAARLDHVPGDERVLGNDAEFAQVVQRIDLTAAPSAGQQLTDAEVDRTVRARWSGLSGCVAKELKRNPGLDQAVITFWVRADGSVGGTKIQSNGTQRMFQCLQTEIAGLRFRAHGGVPRKVTFPLQVHR